MRYLEYQRKYFRRQRWRRIVDEGKHILWVAFVQFALLYGLLKYALWVEG